MPEECILEAADYKECLKGSKTVRSLPCFRGGKRCTLLIQDGMLLERQNIRIYEVFSEREAQVRKASGAAEPAGSHGHH